MKIVFLIILLTIPFIGKSQYNYQLINYTVDLALTTGPSINDTLFVDVDGDGIDDFRCVYWNSPSNGNLGVNIIMFNGGYLYKDNDNGYVKSCKSPEVGNYILSGSGIIYLISDPGVYAGQHVKFPFSINTAGATYKGLLYVNYGQNSLTIEGCAWNPIAFQNIDCELSGWLGVEEATNVNANSEFEYYNYLGQKIVDPHGIVLKVYDNGAVERVYFD